jgi:amidase
MLIKDNIDTYDMRTTCGSKAMANCTPEIDAFLVEKLRAAGAVVLGKVHQLDVTLIVE